ncbi:3 beta-hydroxysteroid dehydrogenase/Delta 5--_4-isomerase [bacterium HR30]|nr:3 beta-hydroxysteroid dehydrogenase/Delta 5-->4-isomerase [bacterium HR30]
MRVLITGAAGFLGRALVDACLQQGWEVRAAVRRHRGEPWPRGVEELVGDLTDQDFVQRSVSQVHGVIHAAARVTTTGSWEDFASVNVRATMALLQAARSAGVGTFVHVSSLSVYDVPADNSTLTENSSYESETNARGHYSRSKLAADRAVLWEARQGAPALVLRPGLLWGPGRQPPLARQIVAWRDWRFVLARKDYPLPLSHVRSVALAAVRGLEKGTVVTGRAFNVVDVHVPQKVWLDAYRELTGVRWRPVYLPVRLVAASARAVEGTLRLLGRRSPLTYHQVARATRRAYYECASAESLLGWQPRTTWREDLREVLQSLQSSRGE